jgi:exonuclease III
MDMRFGTWNIRSLYRAGSILRVSRDLARYKLDLVGVQEVRREGGGTETAGENIDVHIAYPHLCRPVFPIFK